MIIGLHDDEGQQYAGSCGCSLTTEAYASIAHDQIQKCIITSEAILKIILLFGFLPLETQMGNQNEWWELPRSSSSYTLVFKPKL